MKKPIRTVCVVEPDKSMHNKHDACMLERPCFSFKYKESHTVPCKHYYSCIDPESGPRLEYCCLSSQKS